MAIQIQLRQGTTTEHNTFKGAVGELTYDTEKKQIRVHDGTTVGGTILANHRDIDENLLNYLPTPYPKNTPPVGYLALMGQTISQTTYPKLFALYGAVLPDLRAYTIRGLDNGRGVDIGRTILSEQGDAIRNITGTFPQAGTTDSTGVFFVTSTTAPAKGSGTSYEQNSRITEFNASRVVPTANEVRVKNIAFLYIVKAG